MKKNKTDILFYMALFFASWFALAGMVWAYWGALFIAYPFGVISFIIWKVILQKESSRRNKIIPIVLSVGLVFSFVVLICLLISN